ncbi:MAG: hypothetical protein IKO93_08790 [Lentisphaeria bacterium]|nr:hypothetical protein [Lentisphaeria bacterium]
MSIVSKLTAGLLASACVGMLSAQEVISIEKPADFAQKRQVAQADDGAIILKGNGAFISVKELTVDPAKKYQISGEFYLKTGKTPNVYLGFVPYDGKNRQITPSMIYINVKSLTEVAGDAKKGDQVIKVKDASKWDAKSPHSFVALGAKEDLSDLPNGNCIFNKPGITQNGDVWEIAVRKPLTRDIEAGTKVRQHFAGSSYIYTAGMLNKPSGQWVTKKGEISGIAKYGAVYNKFWTGTKKAKVVVLILNGDGKTETLVRNVKVVEVK